MRAHSIASRLAVLALVVVATPSCLWLFPYSSANICETFIRAQCHFAFACCNASERSDFVQSLGKYRNEDDCVHEQLVDTCGAFAVLIESEAQGRYDLDEQLLQTCLSPQVDAMNKCDAQVYFDPGQPSDDCANVSFFTAGTGKVADGDLCFEAFECETEGAICREEAVKENADGDDEFLVSSRGECIPPAQEGDSCTEIACDAGLYCGGNGNGDLVCQRLKDEGQACGGGNECKSGSCQFNGTTFQLECTALLQNGTECDFDFQCLSGNCDDTLNPPLCADVPADDVTITVEACDGLNNETDRE